MARSLPAGGSGGPSSPLWGSWWRWGGGGRCPMRWRGSEWRCPVTQVTQKAGCVRANIFVLVSFGFCVACKDVQNSGDASERQFSNNASPKLILAGCSEMGLGSFGSTRRTG
ncbi:hypothetical protein SBA4_1390017 [Candidatus Sulfopaludibacter sp. SbA4]|nr:hypothetical protein SBA4_1390017 [Candidatus Sulfopaludibacter sp. SbA4]